MDHDYFSRRKQIFEVIQVIIGVVFAFVMIMFMSMDNALDSPISIVSFVLLGVIILPQFILARKLKQLKKDYKTYGVVAAFKKTFPNLRYDAEMGFTKDEVYASKIVKKEDRFSSEDYITGEIAGCRFESADIHLLDRRSNGKSTSYVTVFQGRFYRIHLDKPFPLGVYILPTWYNRFKLDMQYKKFDVEGIEFNKKFNVYSNDHHEALLRVRPVVIDKILAFSKTVKKVTIGFEGTHIYIAIDNRQDNFDLKLFKPLDFNFEKQIKKELKLTEDLINLLT